MVIAVAVAVFRGALATIWGVTAFADPTAHDVVASIRSIHVLFVVVVVEIDMVVVVILSRLVIVEIKGALDFTKCVGTFNEILH